MAYRIELAQQADKEYDDIISYVATRFGVGNACDVEEKFHKRIQQIAENPKQFPFFDKTKNIRRFVISQQTTLYYKFEIDTVIILSFRSNWINPKSKNL